MSERYVEIPYLYNNIKQGSKVLDIGMDRVGYTDYLLGMDCQVFACDPARSDCAYPIKFQDMSEDSKFDAIILLSSLEHFDISLDNFMSANTEIEVIKKCMRMLNQDGVIILTVPFGIEKIYGDFVQWNLDRVRKVIKNSFVIVRDECVFKCELQSGVMEDWKLSTFKDASNCEYYVERGHAAAVYMAVLQ